MIQRSSGLLCYTPHVSAPKLDNPCVRTLATSSAVNTFSCFCSAWFDMVV